MSTTSRGMRQSDSLIGDKALLLELALSTLLLALNKRVHGVVRFLVIPTQRLLQEAEDDDGLSEDKSESEDGQEQLTGEGRRGRSSPILVSRRSR